MNKAGVAREVVARALLSTEVGDQIPTTTDLAKQARSGHGTIQTALRALEDAGAVKTTAHGSFGRRVVEHDLKLLWGETGRGALTGVMPLPESREFAGLATALASLADHCGLPFQLLFRQGSSGRLRFLVSERVDFIVASNAAAIRAEGTARMALGEHSFYGENAVVVITAKDRQPDYSGRVPIDPGSPDHTMLTLQEFPDAQHIETPYMFIPELVANGQLDAAVWHRTASSPLLTATGLSIHAPRAPLSNDELNRAALIWRADDVGVGKVIHAVFAPEKIESIQRDVMGGKRIPQF